MVSNERLRVAVASAGLRLEDVAQEVGVDPKTVQRWIGSGRLPHRVHRVAVSILVAREETYLWPELVAGPEARALGEAELAAYYPSRAAVPTELWLTPLERAARRVEILVYAGQFLVDSRTDFAEALVDKAESGAVVRLLLGDPESESVRRRGAEEGIGADLAARIRITLRGLAAAVRHPGVEVRLHAATLYASTYRFDDEMLVNTHVFGRPAAAAPVLHLRRFEGAQVFGQYEGAFERIWERESREYQAVEEELPA